MLEIDFKHGGLRWIDMKWLIIKKKNMK
jgi:hypothetical protein